VNVWLHGSADPVPFAPSRSIERIRGKSGLALGKPEAPDRGLDNMRLFGEREREQLGRCAS
jgi:hypothetical protein